MKKTTFSLLLIVLLTLVIPTTAFAEGNAPVGDCPASFNLHMVMDHANHVDHMHKHVGNDSDKNGDGFICGKHVGKNGNVHVHIDNNLPLN